MCAGIVQRVVEVEKPRAVLAYGVIRWPGLILLAKVMTALHLMTLDHCPNPVIGQDIEQQCMLNPAVNDVYAPDAIACRIEC